MLPGSKPVNPESPWEPGNEVYSTEALFVMTVSVGRPSSIRTVTEISENSPGAKRSHDAEISPDAPTSESKSIPESGAAPLARAEIT